VSEYEAVNRTLRGDVSWRDTKTDLCDCESESSRFDVLTDYFRTSRISISMSIYIVKFLCKSANFSSICATKQKVGLPQFL